MKVVTRVPPACKAHCAALLVSNSGSHIVWWVATEPHQVCSSPVWVLPCGQPQEGSRPL